MRQRVQHRDIGAWPQRQVVLRLHVRRVHEVDPPRVDHDQPRAAPRSRRLRWEANTGCPSVGLAPITSTTSACSMESKSLVPAEVPNVVLSP